MTSPTPLPPELLIKLSELQAALVDRSPQLPNILQTIHATLRAQPENVTLLSEDQISQIVQGLQLQTQTSLVTATTKKPASAIAKIKSNAADALGL